jgi:hypothetical protein
LERALHKATARNPAHDRCKLPLGSLQHRSNKTESQATFKATSKTITFHAACIHEGLHQNMTERCMHPSRITSKRCTPAPEPCLGMVVSRKLARALTRSASLLLGRLTLGRLMLLWSLTPVLVPVAPVAGVTYAEPGWHSHLIIVHFRGTYSTHSTRNILTCRILIL